MNAWLLALLTLAAPAGWARDDLAAALAATGPEGVLLVEVSAVWCAPCHQLALEVLDTPAGAALVGPGDAGLAVDFDSEAGRAIAKRLTVISLPTTLVLDARGAELGRVEGYPGRAAWLEAIADARAGRAGVAALAARAAAAPDDLDLAIDLAWAQLIRGDAAAALPTLGRLSRRSDAFGVRAGRLLGRWHLRVRGDARAAVAHFRAMVARHARGPAGGGLRYWLATAHHEAGDRAAARAVFARWRRQAPRSPDPLAYEADFLVQHGYPRAEAEPVLAAALAAAPGDASLHHLHAKLLAERGAALEAHAAIDRALALAPGEALYLNFKRALPLPAPPAVAPGVP